LQASAAAGREDDTVTADSFPSGDRGDRPDESRNDLRSRPSRRRNPQTLQNRENIKPRCR